MKLALMFAILVAPAAAQQDKEAVKKRLMDQVKARLEKERKAVLDRIGKLIDEELEKAPAGGPIAEQIDKRLLELELTIANAQAEARELEVWKADMELISALQNGDPLTDQDLQGIWTESFAALSEDKEFEKGNRGFKTIYYFLKLRQSTHSYVQISPYNIACGYALWGKEHQKEALDWLEIALRNGYGRESQGCVNGCQYDPDPHTSFEHMEVDTDLENLRDSDRWKELMRRYKP